MSHFPHAVLASSELSKLLDLFANSDEPPVPHNPEPAAAVVVMREAESGLEVFMTRNTDARGDYESDRWGFPFAPVRSADARTAILAGWNVAKCARMLRKHNETQSLGYFAAAGRIAFESLGILLAEDADGHVALREELPHMDASRQELIGGNVDFAEVLAARQLVFRPDLMRPWMRWINTPWQLRRYDTVYFVAVVPPGQTIDFYSPVGAWGGWVTPGSILDVCAEHGSDVISGPVRLVCESLQGIQSPGAAMCKVRDLSPITPEVFRCDGRWWVSLDPLADPSIRGTVRKVELTDDTDGNPGLGID